MLFVSHSCLSVRYGIGVPVEESTARGSCGGVNHSNCSADDRYGSWLVWNDSTYFPGQRLSKSMGTAMVSPLDSPISQRLFSTSGRTISRALRSSRIGLAQGRPAD